jgi:hypothetical protein
LRVGEQQCGSGEFFGRGPAAHRDPGVEEAPDVRVVVDSVYGYADGWQKTGATEGMHDELRRQCRIAVGRKPEPTAAVIDSQSVKAAETVAKSGRQLPSVGGFGYEECAASVRSARR